MKKGTLELGEGENYLSIHLGDKICFLLWTKEHDVKIEGDNFCSYPLRNTRSYGDKNENR